MYRKRQMPGLVNIWMGLFHCIYMPVSPDSIIINKEFFIIKRF